MMHQACRAYSSLSHCTMITAGMSANEARAVVPLLALAAQRLVALEDQVLQKVRVAIMAALVRVQNRIVEARISRLDGLSAPWMPGWLLTR
jgi:hypothetical protein